MLQAFVSFRVADPGRKQGQSQGPASARDYLELHGVLKYACASITRAAAGNNSKEVLKALRGFSFGEQKSKSRCLWGRWLLFSEVRWWFLGHAAAFAGCVFRSEEGYLIEGIPVPRCLPLPVRCMHFLTRDSIRILFCMHNSQCLVAPRQKALSLAMRKEQHESGHRVSGRSVEM